MGWGRAFETEKPLIATSPEVSGYLFIPGERLPEGLKTIGLFYWLDFCFMGLICLSMGQGVTILFKLTIKYYLGLVTQTTIAASTAIVASTTTTIIATSRKSWFHAFLASGGATIGSVAGKYAYGAIGDLGYDVGGATFMEVRQFGYSTFTNFWGLLYGTTYRDDWYILALFTMITSVG